MEVDLLKPLKAGFWLKRPSGLGKIWANVRYEKLQNICYHCGIVGHDFKNCIQEKRMSEHNSLLPMFTAELRVNPMRAIAPVIMIREGEYDSVQMEAARESQSTRKSVEESEGSKNVTVRKVVTQQGSTWTGGAKKCE